MQVQHLICGGIAWWLLRFTTTFVPIAAFEVRMIALAY
jgi:hypothetical protein